MRAEKHTNPIKESEAFVAKDVFCSIIDRKTPSIRIFETELALAIMDLSGYPLVLSKEHTTENIPQILELAGKLIPYVKRAYHADAIRIQLNDGVAAGQEIPHPHVHIMPRVQIENGVGRTIMIKDQEEKEKMARKLKELARELFPHMQRKK